MTHPAADPPGRGGEDLDPEIRRFVREMGAAWARHPDLATVTHAEARRIAELVRAPWTRGGPVMASVDELRVPTTHGDVRLRRYDPLPSSPRPALVYLHGGGWTLFSLDTHDRVMRELAARAGIVVLGVDYALSPEARYPVALEQVCDVVRHVAARAADLGVAPGGVALGGDSAGGNLSISAFLKLREGGAGCAIRALALVYPVLERRSTPAARARYGGAGYMLGADEMEQFWHNYLGDEHAGDDPLVSPLRAELAGLPPTLLVVPECDLLAEQGLRMAERLRAAGVAVELKVYAGASHSFLEAVSIAPLADRALADAAAWLRAVLAGDRR